MLDYEINNHENFVQQSSCQYLTNRRRPACRHTCGSLAFSSMCNHDHRACDSTVVYYVRASWVRRFTKLKPHENFVVRFLEPIREILSPQQRLWYPHTKLYDMLTFFML